MSDKRTPVKHGQVKPKPSERKKGPVIPRVFHGKAITGLEIGYDVSVAKYGLWEVRCLVGTTLPGGVPFNPGDTATIPGNAAVNLAINGFAEFIDRKVHEENEAMEKARELGLDRP